METSIFIERFIRKITPARDWTHKGDSRRGDFVIQAPGREFVDEGWLFLAFGGAVCADCAASAY
ncbi:MAG: hypothetical protein ACFB22_01145, partial [Rhodothalassiaceae bacterium]